MRTYPVKVDNEDVVKKVLDELDGLNIPYVFWGGLAYALYTGKDTHLKDVDILVSIDDMRKIILFLYDLGIEFKYVPGWESIVVKHEGQTIDMDPKEKYLDSQDYKEFNLFGRKIKVVTPEELVRMYKVAIEKKSSKSEKYKKRVEDLMKILQIQNP